MQPHQERVVTEKSELDEKIVKLTAFFSTRIFDQLPYDEQERLRRQWKLMDDYSGVLAERIEAFK